MTTIQIEINCDEEECGECEHKDRVFFDECGLLSTRRRRYDQR